MELLFTLSVWVLYFMGVFLFLYFVCLVVQAVWRLIKRIYK